MKDPRTVFSDTESTKFLRYKIWEIIPGEMKELDSLQFAIFKSLSYSFESTFY